MATYMEMSSSDNHDHDHAPEISIASTTGLMDVSSPRSPTTSALSPPPSAALSLSPQLHARIHDSDALTTVTLDETKERKYDPE
jgi:hypothetical protein